MPHPLEDKYGLTAQELLDAIDRRMRLKVALEGAVAEVHFERKVKVACQEGWLQGYVDHDEDDMHDLTITTLEGKVIRVEVKTVRNGPKPKVELQKTRTATSDPTSRFYDDTKFDVVAVCVGRFTGDWSQFRYALTRDLPKHKVSASKIQVMHSIPDGDDSTPRWYSKLQDVIDAY